MEEASRDKGYFGLFALLYYLQLILRLILCIGMKVGFNFLILSCFRWAPHVLDFLRNVVSYFFLLHSRQKQYSNPCQPDTAENDLKDNANQSLNAIC